MFLATMIPMLFSMDGNAASTWYFNETDFKAAVSTSLLEDFETFTSKHTQLKSFASNGITYTGFAGFGGGNVWVASPGYPNFGAGVTRPTITSILTANGAE